MPEPNRQETFDSSIAKHEAFWVEKLENLQPITIPYADQTASYFKKRFKSVKIPVHDEILSFLEGRNSNWNLGNFFCAAFVGYLARIGGTNSFDLGFRDIKLAKELNNSPGFFSACVPCHLEINFEQSFEEFFAAIIVQIELTKQHLTYARDTVVRYPTLCKTPELTSPDIFPVAIEWVEKIAEQQGNPGYELTLIISADERECFWLYNAEAFATNSITMMLEQFTIFLQGIATDATQSLAHLPLLAEWERHKILVEWNNTAVEYPKDKCLHQLFEAQVAKTPDTVAVVFEDQQLTYRELNERANQVAYYLQGLGVKPETLVSICIKRSLEMMVGLLGILKAGGAYLPLDPNYPPERLQFMLQDSAAPVLLTQQKLIERLPPHDAQVVCLDTEWSKIAEYSNANIQSEVQPGNLAYIIYTSGSTGKPKGVLIRHRNVVNLINSVQKQPGLTAADTLLSVTTISFDIAVSELFLPLSVGAKLVIVSSQVASDGIQLLEVLNSSGATFMQPTPITWRLLLKAGWQGNSNLKAISTGEALPRELANRLLPMVSELWNLYGPTETTIWSTACQVQTGDQAINIGKPISNTQVYILDANLQPVPIGVPGELHLGGDGVTKGYLNRSELTEEKFIANPFSSAPNSKLYKTGDLVKFLPNGVIECLGRIDHQVKVRGFRIELGEIEAAIALHPNIQQTVVIVREDNPGDKRLVAYIAPNSKQIVSTEEIRRLLKQKLPNYMVPGAFVFLETLPLTFNGKIDRRALPTPEQARSQPEQTFVAPRNQLELQLAKIWEDVLGIKHIGIHDNFFDLGGQSLLAVRLFVEIHKSFNQKLTLSTILQASTIEQLAKVISQKEYAPNSSYLVPIQPHGSKIPFFCIHGAQGEVLFFKSLASYLSRDQPFYAIRSPGQNGETAPLNCIKEMAKLYIEEIKTRQPQGPYLLGGYSFGGLVAFEMARQFKEQGQEVSLLALLDCYAPGSLQYLPLHQIFLQHFRNFLSFGPDYLFNKLKTFRTRIMYRLLKDEAIRNNYFHHLTSTKYFYNLINEFPNYTVEDLKLWENLYKANLQASSNYIPSVYAGKITIFRVKTDPTQDFYQPVTKCGWSELSNQEVEVYDCTGDHYTFIEEPHVQSLARQLQSCLISAKKL